MSNIRNEYFIHISHHVVSSCIGRSRYVSKQLGSFISPCRPVIHSVLFIQLTNMIRFLNLRSQCTTNGFWILTSEAMNTWVWKKYLQWSRIKRFFRFWESFLEATQSVNKNKCLWYLNIDSRSRKCLSVTRISVCNDPKKGFSIRVHCLENFPTNFIRRIYGFSCECKNQCTASKNHPTNSYSPLYGCHRHLPVCLSVDFYVQHFFIHPANDELQGVQYQGCHIKHFNP